MARTMKSAAGTPFLETAPMAEPAAFLDLGKLDLEADAAATATRRVYQNLVAGQLEAALAQGVRFCLQTGTPLGNDWFRLHIQRTLGLPIGYSARDRPKELPNGSAPDLDQMELDLGKRT